MAGGMLRSHHKRGDGGKGVRSRGDWTRQKGCWTVLVEGPALPSDQGRGKGVEAALACGPKPQAEGPSWLQVPSFLHSGQRPCLSVCGTLSQKSTNFRDAYSRKLSLSR